MCQSNGLKLTNDGRASWDVATTLSSRACARLKPAKGRELARLAFKNQYDEKSNPDGVIPMAVAEHHLVQQKILECINAHFKETSQMLSQRDSPGGSMASRRALSRYLNDILMPCKEICPEEVLPLSGVTSVINTVAFSICNEGEGILIGSPLDANFISDLGAMSRVVPIQVDLSGTEPMSAAAVAKFDEAFVAAQEQHIPVRAILLFNPHQSNEQRYSAENLAAYLEFCAKHGLHLLSDEVYAKPGLPGRDITQPQDFVSVLSLDIAKYISPWQVHVFYGTCMSNDVCSDGLKIGALVSQYNPALINAVQAISHFAWAAAMPDHAWEPLLKDKAFLKRHFPLQSRRFTSAYKYCAERLPILGIPYLPAFADGPFLWLDLSRYLQDDSDEGELNLALRLVNGGIWLETRAADSFQQRGRFRMTLAIPRSEMKLGMERLSAVIEKLKKALVDKSASCSLDQQKLHAKSALGIQFTYSACL